MSMAHPPPPPSLEPPDTSHDPSAASHAVPASEARPKPLLRGVSHQIGFFAALPILFWLFHGAQSELAARCVAVYATALLALLGISASYHRINLKPRPRARMKRLDHSAIFLLIAGTYTPIFMLGVGGARGDLLCMVLWAGAALGIAQTLFWPSAPRALHVGLYVVLGWIGAFGLVAEAAHIGATGMAFHILGGVLYTIGAVIYARKRPDPWPRVFGYHEIFHLLVLVACGCLFEVVRRCLLVAAT